MISFGNTTIMATTDYIELASPQILDGKWRELNFDIATDQNTLQNLDRPETGGGYVYKDAKQVGSPTHNRFIYWRAANDLLELVEISTEMILDGGQVRIRFANSPVISNINVIEFSDHIVILVATLTSVHRIHLPHPKITNKSVLNDLTSEVLFDPSSYYILNQQQSVNPQQPLCAASWQDEDLVRCAVSFPDSSILIITFGGYIHPISVAEIKQTGIIGRLWSRMPQLLSRTQNDCENSVFIIVPYIHTESGDVLLFTLCKDCKIRVFSTNTKECIITHSLIPHQSFSQSFANHTSQVIELPMMRISQSNVIVYLDQERPEFVFLSHNYSDGVHELKEIITISNTPNWEKLIDFAVTGRKIWALSEVSGTERALCYRNLADVIGSSDTTRDTIEDIWESVNVADELDSSSVRNYVAEIFWRNRFSIATIQKALAGVVKTDVPKNCTMETLEQFAFTRIADQNQEEAWARFYDYCLQNHISANKNIGLVVNQEESVISIIKRTSQSFVCPWLMSVDMILQGGPYRGIEFSKRIRGIIEPLNYISTELIEEEYANTLEQKFLQDPEKVLDHVDDIITSIIQADKLDKSRLNFSHKNLIAGGIDYLCEQLDLTKQAEEFTSNLLSESRIRSENNPLESNSGIAITFELFKRLVRARMTLARDLLVYIQLMSRISQIDETNGDALLDMCEDLYTSNKLQNIIGSFRSYSLLVWMSESAIKSPPSQTSTEVVEYMAAKFQFFKAPHKLEERSQDCDLALYSNLVMNFLLYGGTNFTHLPDHHGRTSNSLSDSFYITEIALNLCKLLWPKTNYLCFPEFLLTHHLDEQLDTYLDLTEGLPNQEDRDFIRATNYILLNRATNAVETFNKLSRNIKPNTLICRFIDLSPNPEAQVSSTNIHMFYDKLIQLFQICNNHQCSVMLIHSCLLILEECTDREQQHWVNCLRAKLFNCQLELEETNEAYQTMTQISDRSLRTNCLRKFIVSHCETERWSSLLRHPYDDIMDDFVDILNQKASSSDLSNLNGDNFYKTSYYDVLFSSYISDEEYKAATEVMYNYAQRLAHEVPGVLSIKKQVDCLLTALNSLRCVDEADAFLELGSNSNKEDGRTSVMKRGYDCESDDSIKASMIGGDDAAPHKMQRIYCKDIAMMYELTRARLRLLEKDPISNAIALSPLKVEETIAQLVSSSMFSIAMDLAILFKAPMAPILEGLTAKYLVLRVTSLDPNLSQDQEIGLADIFNQSYSDIDTYNYIANSTSPLVHKIWRLIDNYLVKYDGISHRYSTDEFAGTFKGTTVLMRVVATKILSSGYDIPASLKRMYMTRNVSELLKLLIKYDKLEEASELAIEIMDRTLRPTNLSLTSPLTPQPVYLPTHLILLLISFLQEDATNTEYTKLGSNLFDKLEEFRHFVSN